MKRHVLAGATLGLVACSALLAVPAEAATAGPSTGSNSSTTHESPRDTATPGLTLDSYDPATRTATVSVTGPYANAFTVNHKAASGTPDAGIIRQEKGTITTEGGAKTFTFTQVYRGDTINTVFGLNPIRPEVTFETAPELPAPHVETLVKNGIVDVTYTHYRSGWATVRDADGHQIVQSPRAANQPDGASISRFTMPDSGRTSTYSVVAFTGNGSKSPVDFTINSGMTAASPSAPEVETVTVSGQRAFVAITGEAGAVATIKSPTGTTVAVKTIGSSGAGQLIVPASVGRTTATYSLTQTAGGATSSPTAFTA